MPKRHSSPVRHEDDKNFRRSASDIDRKRSDEARGHDDQGGSRQSEARDYERRQPGAPGSETSGEREKQTPGETRGDARYGEQSAEQRRGSREQEEPENVGGQDSRDQSPEERHSLLGRAGKSGEQDERQVAQAQEQSAQPGVEGASDKAASYESETRDSFSRQYAEYQREEEKRRTAAGGGDYDGNWTRDTDKPAQPGPARRDAS